MVMFTPALLSHLILWKLVVFYMTGKYSVYHVGQIWKEWPKGACFHMHFSYFLTNSAEQTYCIFLVFNFIHLCILKDFSRLEWCFFFFLI